MNVIDYYDRSLSRLSTQITVPGQWQAPTYSSFDHIFSINLNIYRLILTLSCCRIHYLSINMYLPNITCLINYREIFESRYCSINSTELIEQFVNVCKLNIVSFYNLNNLQAINIFEKFRARKLFFENLKRDKMMVRGCGINAFANICRARNRPLIVRVPGTRVSRYRSQRSFRHGPSKLKFRRRKGSETGQPEVVDVQRRIPTQVIIVLWSRTAAEPAVPVMLSPVYKPLFHNPLLCKMSHAGRPLFRFSEFLQAVMLLDRSIFPRNEEVTKQLEKFWEKNRIRRGEKRKESFFF